MTGCGGAIPAVQDAAGVNYNTRLKTEGIGYVSGKTRVVNVHSRPAAAGDGLASGLLYQSSYNRSEPKDDTRSHESKKARPIEEKESWRRLETLERSAQDIPEGVKETTVRGREGDRRGLFRKAGTLGQPFLTRTVQKRLAVENKRTLDEPRKKRRRGRVEATITRDSLSGVPEREAVLQLRHAPFTIKKPDILNPVKTPPESIEANGVSVKGESRDGMGAETSFPMMTGGPASAPEEAYEYVG